MCGRKGVLVTAELNTVAGVLFASNDLVTKGDKQYHSCTFSLLNSRSN
jgi:hypothetical protein